MKDEDIELMPRPKYSESYDPNGEPAFDFTNYIIYFMKKRVKMPGSRVEEKEAFI